MVEITKPSKEEVIPKNINIKIKKEGESFFFIL